MSFSFVRDDLSALSGSKSSVPADLLALVVFDDGPKSLLYNAVDKKLGNELHRITSEEQFKAKRGQSVTVHTLEKLPADRVLLLGAGARKDFKPSDLRPLAARASKAAAAVNATSVMLEVPFTDRPTQDRAAQFAAEGAVLGRYRFDKYLSDKKPRAKLERFSLAFPSYKEDDARLATLRKSVRRGEEIAFGIARARDLVNEPAAIMTPLEMAEVAKRIAKENKLAIKILGPKECEKLGMGMYLAVSLGSVVEPRFIHLTYKPKGKAKRRVVLIGKGVTFDSGGLSLKPSSGMEDMKIDMSGAAAVIAAMGVLAKLHVPYEVHALAACTENMPSGSSYKLGDVLKSMNGKTVEINNTDAEGRLTLGDAITYAVQKIKPDEIFDFATLTGACMVALGPHTAGVMSNNDDLAGRWLAAAKECGEEMWRLPLPDALKDQLKSSIADMRNTGDRYGGALTAGLFLKEFVGETAWVHVDLAGPASSDKEIGHIAKGGTGFAVATMVEYLSHE